HPGASRHDDAGALVAEHDRRRAGRVHLVELRVADAAGEYLDDHLVGAGVGEREVREPQRPLLLRKDDDARVGRHCSILSAAGPGAGPGAPRRAARRPLELPRPPTLAGPTGAASHPGGVRSRGRSGALAPKSPARAVAVAEPPRSGVNTSSCMPASTANAGRTPPRRARIVVGSGVESDWTAIVSSELRGSRPHSRGSIWSIRRRRGRCVAQLVA